MSRSGRARWMAAARCSQSRPDVATAEGNPFWAASGFGAVVPVGALSAGAQTLSVYAHTPGKGWWFKQTSVNVSASAPATATAPATSSAPAVPLPAGASTPVVTGGVLPIV